MDLTIKFGDAGLDWPAICRVFEQAPLGTRDPDMLRRASENSHLVCTLYDKGILIGFGRAISDGVYQSAIYDVVVLPEYQGQGVGKALVEAMLDNLPKGKVLIYAVPGKEGFYRKLGFEILKTGMGLFPDPESARRDGYLF